MDETGTEYYSNFFRGKLIQHCHFVPHEDHGLMAYHELQEPPISFDNDPIIPNSTSGNDYNTSYSPPDKSQWVKDCTKFSGITSVIIEDSKTVLVVYLSSLKSTDTAFLDIYRLSVSIFVYSCFFLLRFWMISLTSCKIIQNVNF